MYTVRLTPSVESKLKTLLSRGKSLARVTKKARILQLVASGNSAERAAKAIGVSPTTARTVCRRFASGGLKHALYDLPRPGHSWLMTSQEEAKLAAMVCSSAPQGLAAWSISVITKEAVGRGIIKHIGRSTIGRFLHRHALKPWLEKNVVRAKNYRDLPSTDGGNTGSL